MYDLLAYDSTCSGIIACIAAARRGLRTVLVTEDRHVGGMQTSGLGWTNAGQRITIGGLAREFFDRVRADYVKCYGEESQQVADFSAGFRFESHVAERIFESWLAEAGVEVVREDPIVAVEKDGATLRAVVTQSGRRLEAKMFVDASYEGDLLALAGCAHHIGRESSSTYGESLAGVRYPPHRRGEGDRALQGFDFRLCLCNDPNNQTPVRPPDDYDADRYVGVLQRLMAHKALERAHEVVPLNPMPNRKTDSRTGEWTGASWGWPEASLEERRQIAAAHRSYSHGYLWFMMSDPAVPQHIREELSQWGFAADEFVDNGNWPYHIYVREARKLVGEFVMTQADVQAERFKPDAVALGSFFLDVHPVQLIAEPGAPSGFVTEGNIGRTPTQPYEIPYRSLLPRRSEATNLLVSVCVSASHIAFSTIRMETVYAMLGHAAGSAAALSLEQGKPLHELDADALKQRLVEEAQIIDASKFNTWWPGPPKESASA